MPNGKVFCVDVIPYSKHWRRKRRIVQSHAPLSPIKIVRDKCAPKRAGEGVVLYSEPSIGGASAVSCNFNGESRGERGS